MNKIIFTAIYRPRFNESLGPLDDQYYGYLMPVRMFNKIYMIDTYHMDSPHWHMDNNDAYGGVILRAEKDHAINNDYTKYVVDYYYKHCYEITEETIDLKYELVCDLKDFKPISSNELYKYNKNDYIENVRLWHECKYPYGYNLIRKNAKENITLKIDNKVDMLIHELKCPEVIYEYEIEELQELVKNTNTYNKNRYNYLIKMNYLLEELKSSYIKRKNKLSKKYLNK